MRFFDQGGLGLGMALGGIINFVIMLYVIRRKLGIVVDRHSITQIGKIAIATVAMSLTLWLVKDYFVNTDYATLESGAISFFQQLIDILMILIIGGSVYLLIAWVTRVDSLWMLLKRKEPNIKK